MNTKKIERVARAICWAASRQNLDGSCVHCEKFDKRDCTMTEQFMDEAIAAIREIER